MSASRHRPKGGSRRIFGLVIFLLAMMPTPIGLQDLAALIARQPMVSDRWRQYTRVTPFGTVQAAAFSFPQPLGTMIPATPGYTFAGLDPRALDITGSIGNVHGNPLVETTPQLQFPAVNRTLKGDLLVPRERLVPAEPQPQEDKPAKTPEKTQDRAQIEEPQPGPQAAEPAPVESPEPKPDIAVVEPAPVPAIETPPAQQAEAPEKATTLDAPRQAEAALPSGMDLEFPLSQPPAEAIVALPSGMDLEFMPLPQAPDAVAQQLPSGMDLEFPLPKQPDIVVALPSGMDLEFVLPQPSFEVIAALPSGMDLEFKLPVRPDVVAALPSGMDLEFALPQPSTKAVAALPSGMDLEFKLPRKPDAVAALPSGMDLEFKLPRRPDAVAALPSGMDLEFSPLTRQAEAEILTDEEPQDTEVAVRSEVQPDNPAARLARLFFGADALGPTENRLQPWRQGEAPVLMPMHPSVDPDIKRAAVAPAQKDAALRPDARSEGETVAPKGEVTGEGRRPMTPAERLGLSGASRAKHERCLTNAIYFEARGEVERGQMAVAQVILNRAFSGYYPDNVCGVVYQNAHRHLACQFTFACDNVRDVVTEPEAWETAKRIARDSLDGKIWLPEIGKATHYHATYVNPWWVRTMTKHKTLGIHIFYRPTRWGDGAEAPAWGPGASAEQSVAKARM